MVETIRPQGSRVQRVSRWSIFHPMATDVAFALVMGAGTLAGYATATPDTDERSFGWPAVVLIVISASAFVERRRRPLWSMPIVIAATIGLWVSNYATNFDAFSLLSIYAASAHGGRDRRMVWRVVGAAVAVMTVIAVLGVLSPDERLPAVAVVGIAAIHLSAAITGEIVYDRRLRLVELEQRARRAEAERELMTRQAVLQERARIARDLHDVVAHGMSVMVVQAGAAQRMLATQPERANEALDHVQATGREALTEMRRMLGVLRSDQDTPERAPQPNLDDLDAIVQRCNDAGVPTELIVNGQPPARAAGAEMAAYRIVQEALTNVIKHAGRPARAVVRVSFDDEQVRLEVDDDGLGADPNALAGSTGHGLVGMRERVELYHGTLRAGPRPGGGFRVAATIPLTATGVPA